MTWFAREISRFHLVCLREWHGLFYSACTLLLASKSPPGNATSNHFTDSHRFGDFRISVSESNSSVNMTLVIYLYMITRRGEFDFGLPWSNFGLLLGDESGDPISQSTAKKEGVTPSNENCGFHYLRYTSSPSLQSNSDYPRNVWCCSTGVMLAYIRVI